MSLASFRIGALAQKQLTTANKIAESVWSLDNILRVISYAALYTATVKAENNGGKLTPGADFLMVLFNKVTDARFVNRIGGLPATLESFFSYAEEAALAEEGKAEADTSTLALLGKVMTGSMILYYPLEHLWLATTFKPDFFPSVNGDYVSILSCRAWLVYVVCDLIGTHIRAKKLSKQIKELQGDKVQQRKELQDQRTNLNLWSYCVLCDLVMAAQWSVASGPFTTKQICFSGISGGLVSLYLKWKRA